MIKIFFLLLLLILKNTYAYISAGNCIQSPVISDFNATQVLNLIYKIYKTLIYLK